MEDSLGHISRKTRERAHIMSKNALALGIELGDLRFTPQYDYLSYYLANGTSYLIVFCTPLGYLVERWEEDEEGHISTEFSFVRNIRHFLQWALREGYEDVEALFDSEDEDEGPQDLRSFLENTE